jgi:glycerophosphoryl diester phosphodiesterase
VILIGHRGASAQAPENTFASFDLAISQGADAVETDIRATKDGALVLMHDATVDRTTNGRGAVGELRLAEIEALDAGSWFGPRFAGERAPTLDGFLARYARRLPLVLEIKEPGTVAGIVDLVNQHQAEATYVSFHVAALERVLQITPEARVGILTTTLDEELMTRAAGLGSGELVALASAVTLELVQSVHRLGLAIRAWGIRDVGSLLRVASMGVDGVAVDWPGAAREALAKRRDI